MWTPSENYLPPLLTQGSYGACNIRSTFCSTVNLLPKELRFEHGGAKLASCPGFHPTLLRPCYN